MTSTDHVDYEQQWADAAKRYYHTEPAPIVYKPCMDLGEVVCRSAVAGHVHLPVINSSVMHCAPTNNFTKVHAQPPLTDALKRSMRESVARAWNEANTEEIS